MKGFLGAAAAACALLCAGQASATVMVTRLSGDWNDSPGRDHWIVEVKYDTDLLTKSTSGTITQYSWDIADGTPSPITYATGTFYGYTPCPNSYPSSNYCGAPVFSENFDATSLNSFSIQLISAPSYQEIGFLFAGPGLQFGGYHYLDGDFVVDQPLSINGYGDYGFATINGHSWGSVHAHVIQSAPVPEPAAWAMLLMGFFGLGGALRRRRWTTLAA